MKKSIISIIIFLLATSYSFCQLTVGYNMDGNTLIISSNPTKKAWCEFRVSSKDYNQASWSYSDRGITQAYAMISLFSSKNAVLYGGGGVGANLFSSGSDKWVSVNIPVGLRLNPFEKFPNLYLTGEYNPMILLADKVTAIHSVSLGFRYVLSRKTDKE
jgi:hypothetical protein